MTERKEVDKGYCRCDGKSGGALWDRGVGDWVWYWGCGYLCIFFAREVTLEMFNRRFYKSPMFLHVGVRQLSIMFLVICNIESQCL